MVKLLSVIQHGSQETVLESHSKLIFETVAPVRVLIQLSHSAHEAARKESLGNIETLKLMHSLYLLVALGTRNCQSLVFLLDQRDLTVDFLLPLSMIILLSLLVFLFELADFLKLGFFLDLKDGLLDGLGQQDVENWLDLTVIIK